MRQEVGDNLSVCVLNLLLEVSTKQSGHKSYESTDKDFSN